MLVPWEVGRTDLVPDLDREPSGDLDQAVPCDGPLSADLGGKLLLENAEDTSFRLRVEVERKDLRVVHNDLVYQVAEGVREFPPLLVQLGEQEVELTAQAPDTAGVAAPLSSMSRRRAYSYSRARARSLRSASTRSRKLAPVISTGGTCWTCTLARM